MNEDNPKKARAQAELPPSPLDHAAAAADDCLQDFVALEDEYAELIRSSRPLRAAVAEASGLLEGMSHRRITAGQQRLGELLRTITQELPSDQIDDRWFDLIASCAAFGLSVEGNALGAYYAPSRSGRWTR
jgi:hypothetical protein